MKKLILLALVATTMFSCKQGPTTEQYRDLYRTLIGFDTLSNKGQFTEEEETKLKAYLQKQDSLYDMKKATYKQMINITRIARIDATYQWLLPALQAKAAQNSDSSVILEYLMFQREKDAKLTFDRFMKIMAKPSVLLSDQNTCGVLKLFSQIEMKEEEKDALTIEFYKHLIPHINAKTHIYAYYNLTNEFWKRILNMGDKFPKELKEEYYQANINGMKAALVESKDPNIKNLESTLESFNTLFARGELIGSQAPELNFLWNSAGMELKNLADLKGKVVLLDFWATWCGPCVRSFPNVRKLQERYKDYDVVILGVTSIQGRHIDRLNKKTIDTKGNPEKEFNLMKTFMRDQKMTWTVAFAEQKVYNPNYGVLGIPHCVILDTEGKVRYNGINPNSLPLEEAEKIDALLKEAGLKYPTEPMENRNWAEEEAAKAEAKAKKK